MTIISFVTKGHLDDLYTFRVVLTLTHTMPAPSLTPVRASAPSSKTRDRALRAMRCTVLAPTFYETLPQRSLRASELAGQAGVQRGYTTRARSELSIESDLTWLIQVGVLRREVDGQGITDGFRLTPLGTELAQQQRSHPSGQSGATWGDRLRNQIRRWLSIFQ